MSISVVYANSRIRAVSFFVFLCLTVSAHAQQTAESITVNNPYVRAVPPMAATTAAFMQIQNQSEEARLVTGAYSPAAQVAELHMHIHDDGMMRMRQIPHIHLPPQSTVALEPAGLHIMLFKLKNPLSVGDQVPITLSFDDGSSKEISAVVRLAQ